MSKDYTPSTEEVRNVYTYIGQGFAPSQRKKEATADAEFDRWLAQHDAELTAERDALAAVIEQARTVVRGGVDIQTTEALQEWLVLQLDPILTSVDTGAALREHDAKVLEDFADTLTARYPEAVFRPLSDADHRSVNDALSGRAERTHVSRDAVSADMMRRAAEQARQEAADIREGRS